MLDKISILLELEKRGQLPPEKAPILLELRKRGLLGTSGVEQLITPIKEVVTIAPDVKNNLYDIAQGHSATAMGTKLPTPMTFPDITYHEQLNNIPANIGKGYQSAAQGIEQSVKQGSKRMQQSGIVNQLRGGVQAGLGTAGNIASAVFNPIIETVKGVIPQTKSPLANSITTGAGMGATLGGGIGSIIGGIISAGFYGKEVVQKKLLENPQVAEFIKNNPDVIPDIDNAINVALSSIGGKKVGKLDTGILDKPIAQIPKEFTNNMVSTAKLPLELIGKGISAIGNKFVKSAGEDSAKINNLVGKITQGKIEDIPAAKKALLDINTEGVKTHEDLKSVLNTKIENLSNGLNEMLLTTPETKPLNALKTKITFGNKTVKHNYVVDAIGQLKNYYEKTNNVPKLLETNQLWKKIKTKGLSIKEINDLAKLHGQELNGFNANGELASGLTKQAAENTRTGLKETARNLFSASDKTFGKDTYKAVDEQLSNLINTRNLIEKVNEKVNQANQTAIPRGLLEKAGGTIANIMDVATGRIFSGAARKILIPRGGGIKQMNALDIEANLNKFLKQFKQANKTEPTIERKITTGKFLQDVGKNLQNPTIPEFLKGTRTSQRGQIRLDIIKDPSRVQEIKNSIMEGQNILRSGKDFDGKTLTQEKILQIRNSVENDLRKIGESRISQKGYMVEDVTPKGYSPGQAIATQLFTKKVKSTGVPKQFIKK